MTVHFFGRASCDIEDIQPSFKRWLADALTAEAPRSDFVIVFKAFAQYEQVMPSIRVFALKLAERDIVIEVFPRGSTLGLSFGLYLPDEADREELVGYLRRCASTFSWTPA